MSRHTHARKFSGHRYDYFVEDVVEEYRPLCGTFSVDPDFSETPDCGNCRRILQRDRKELVSHFEDLLL